MIEDKFTDKPLRPKKKKKKKAFVVEYRRFSGYSGCLSKHYFPKNWKKWRAYATKSGALSALKSYKAKYKFLEFRMKP